MKAAGFAIGTAANGIDALKKARTVSPDLILLDVMMPGLDGFAVCETLRGNPATASIPILMLTGLCSHISQLVAFESGATDYLIKPFNPEELVSKVEKLLGRSQRLSLIHIFKDLEQLIRVHPGRSDNEFSVQPMAEDLGVKMNGTDVIQILLNLAVNAFQCAPLSHRVEVGGEILREPLDLTAFKDGPNDRLLNVEGMDNTAPLVKLWVRDTGPGIPVEVLPKIFQPYFTTKGPRQGTGLGLNIVQRLIKEGKGALHVHTRPGEGTTLSLIHI